MVVMYCSRIIYLQKKLSVYGFIICTLPHLNISQIIFAFCILNSTRDRLREKVNASQNHVG